MQRQCDFYVDLMEAHEAFEGCYDHLAETEAQHKSETAAFGDSWPGALEDIERARRASHEAHEWLLKLEALLEKNLDGSLDSILFRGKM
jgi:hypothetical protein